MTEPGDQGPSMPAGEPAVDTVEVLDVSPRTGGRRILALGVAVVAVLGAAGVGFAAGSMVGGGGRQPEDVLPASVIAYADLDLDPAPGQKLNVVRLLGRFPSVKDQYGSQPDVRDVLVQQFTKDTGLAAADVGQWAGDRLGVGVAYDADTQALTPVLAVQVSDESAAVHDLTPLVGSSRVAAADGYVVVTGDTSDLGAGSSSQPQVQSAAEVVAAGQTAALADSPSFQDAFSHLDDGVATFYADGPGMAEAIQSVAKTLGTGDMLTGRDASGLTAAGVTAAVLRAEPDAIELAGWSSAAQPDAAPVSLVGGLPDSTLLALEVTGGSKLIDQRWQALEDAVVGQMGRTVWERELAQIEAQYDLRLPDDLKTLLGDDAVLAADTDGLLTGVPPVGLRSVTDPSDGADLARRLQHTLAGLTGGFGVTARGTDNGMVIASTPQYADQLTAGDGGLGSSPSFQRAVPDAASATAVVYVDIGAVSGTLALAAPDAAGVLTPLDSFGLTAMPDDGGTAVRARLVFSSGSDS